MQTPIELWPHQVSAVEEAVDAHQHLDMVVIDAPTGSGKTIIAEEVRRRLGLRGLYVCTTKGLQDQFMQTFPEGKLVKGRANYQTQLRSDLTCEDCLGPACAWCEDGSLGGNCPYSVAKRAAVIGPLGVLNTAYWVRESNYSKGFTGAEYVTVDEADELEGLLMGFVEFDARSAKGASVPKPGVHKGTIATWLRETYAAMCKNRLAQVDPEKDPSLVRYWRGQMTQALWLANELTGENAGQWVRENGTDGKLVMKPVTVSHYGQRNLWRHGKKWTLMSGTVIDPEMMLRELGWEGDWHCVEVPMTFDVDNRPIVVAGVADITSKSTSQDYDRLAEAIRVIANKHRGERILVHTVSFKLTGELMSRLSHAGLNRPVLTYGAGDRDRVFKEYCEKEGAMLLAPSMDRGYDFANDLARVVIVAKCPFPALSPQNGARLHLPGGNDWYRVQTVRTLMQMTGRGVRNADDHCTTYILDRQFISNVWKNSKNLFPRWWRDAVDFSQPTRNFFLAA